jgi:hypothetical protein
VPIPDHSYKRHHRPGHRTRGVVDYGAFGNELIDERKVTLHDYSSKGDYALAKRPFSLAIDFT